MMRKFWFVSLFTTLLALLSLVALTNAVRITDFLFAIKKLKIPRNVHFIRIEKYKQN